MKPKESKMINGTPQQKILDMVETSGLDMVIKAVVDRYNVVEVEVDGDGDIAIADPCGRHFLADAQLSELVGP